MDGTSLTHVRRWIPYGVLGIELSIDVLICLEATTEGWACSVHCRQTAPFWQPTGSDQPTCISASCQIGILPSFVKNIRHLMLFLNLLHFGRNSTGFSKGRMVVVWPMPYIICELIKRVIFPDTFFWNSLSASQQSKMKRWLCVFFKKLLMKIVGSHNSLGHKGDPRDWVKKVNKAKERERSLNYSGSISNEVIKERGGDGLPAKKAGQWREPSC